MGIQVLGPIASASSVNADSYTVPAALKRYKVIKDFDAAVYTITTSPSSSEATVLFGGASSFPTTTTVSGTVTYNLASSATNAYIYINTGTNVVVTITKVAAALSGAELSGTLDTVTSSGTYNQTGALYVLAVGGGGGGGGGLCGFPNANWAYASGGGRGSTPVGAMVFTNTATTITVGSAGNGAGPGGTGNYGGASSFGNLVVSNGGAGSYYGQVGTDGRGGENGNNTYVNGASYDINHPTVINGSNGTGGGGGSFANGGTGGGSGIGTGGNGGKGTGGITGGNAATGYGAGGGGGGADNGSTTNNTSNGGAGSPGVVYVLRGF